MIQLVQFMLGKLGLEKVLLDESATASIEYAILLGLIAVGVIALVAFVGGWVSGQWVNLSTELAAAS